MPVVRRRRGASSFRHSPLVVMAVALLSVAGPSVAMGAQLTLSWQDNAANESGFRIQRKVGSTGSYVAVTTVAANVTSYTDTGLADGTSYCYLVQAYNGSGSSPSSNEACGTTGPTAASSVILTVSMVGGGKGTVSGPGIACGTDCGESVVTGTVVPLTATAAAGSTFIGWSGGCSGTGPCTATVSAPTVITASFGLPQRLSVARAGAGAGTVTGPGIGCGTDCAESVAPGTVASLAATPAAGSVFTGWSGGGCSGTGPCTVTVTAPTTVTATFGLAQLLSVARTGAGAGTVTGPGIACGTDCSERVPPGTVVSLTATPAAGSVFTGWSGGGCSGTGPCTVTVSSAVTVNAAFAVRTHGLTVTRGGTGAGSVSGPGILCGSDCSESVASGTTATLIATPAVGSTFTGWSGACGGMGACTVTVSASTAVAATFAEVAGTELAVVTGTGPSAQSRVRGFDDGGAPNGIDFLAYGTRFTGGVFVALGRPDDSGLTQIVAGTGPGTVAEVRTFRADNAWTGLSFRPYTGAFTGGVRVAACDVDGDGIDEIVTVPGPGRAPTVKIWKVAGTRATRVLAFNVGSGQVGLFVACGDLDGDERAEVVTGRDAGVASDVRIFAVHGTAATQIARFQAYDSLFKGGVRVAVADVGGNGRLDIVTAPGPGVLQPVHLLRLANGVASWLTSFVGADPSVTGGLFVAGGPRDAIHGGATLMVAPGPGSPPYVRTFTASPTLVIEGTGFYAGDPSSREGVTVGAVR